MTEAELAELERLAAKATALPWSYEMCAGHAFAVHSLPVRMQILLPPDDRDGDADVRYAAAAASAVPRLVAALRASQAARIQLSEMDAKTFVDLQLKLAAAEQRAKEAEARAAKLEAILHKLLWHYPDLGEMLGKQGAAAGEILDAARRILATTTPP